MSNTVGFPVQARRNRAGTSTLLPAAQTRGLGAIEVEHPAGTFALTPASLISLTAICDHQRLLSGIGLDWGTGTGCLAIAAARIGSVRKVYGLELDPANIHAARANVARNGVAGKVCIYRSDSYRPFTLPAAHRLQLLQQRVAFILANPLSSEGDDGFEFRREVLRGARSYLRPGGLVFLSISSQYGDARIARLVRDAPGFRYRGLLSSTEPVQFDLSRPDLLHALELYAAEERRGGLAYRFYNPEAPESTLDAVSALNSYRAAGQSPFMRWQTHLFASR